MIWNQTYGSNLDNLLKAKERGLQVPALDNKPELPIHLIPYFECYYDLNGDLSWMVVKQWCEYYNQNFEYCFAVLVTAQNKVEKWRQLNSSHSKTPVAKGTNR